VNRAFRKRVEKLRESVRATSVGLSGVQKAAFDLYEEHYQVTLQCLAQLSSDNALQVAQELTAKLALACQRAEQLSQQMSPGSASRMHCGQGCSWCCYKQIRISPLDAIAAASADLTSTFEYPLPVHPSGAQPCPLLREGRCSVYQARPIVCRAFHSFDSEQCRQGQSKPPMDLEVYGLIGIPQEAALEALADLGLDRSPVLLGEAVSYLRKDFENGLRRWLSGGALVPASS